MSEHHLSTEIKEDVRKLYIEKVRNPHAVTSILHHRGFKLPGLNYQEKLKYVDKEIKRINSLLKTIKK